LNRREISDVYDEGDHTFLNFKGYGAEQGVDFPADDERTVIEQTAAFLADKAGIDGSCTVLEVGDSCEYLLIYLAKWFGCRGEGIFENEEHARFAQHLCVNQRRSLDVAFRRASVTSLPYRPGSFTHVVSHGALHKVQDQTGAYSEIHRVLRRGGMFAFSDFYRPRAAISERTRSQVYDRFGWNGGRTLLEHHAALEEAGFELFSVFNMTGLLRRTFQGNAEAAATRARRAAEDESVRGKMLAFTAACEEVTRAIDRGEVGWAVFVVRRLETAQPE
jgi:sarcosine/dimethylglycine N-methyltransferase